MPIHSRWKVPIEDCSFHQYLLGKPGAQLQDKVAFLDAEDPSRYLTLTSFRLWSQRLAAGLRKAGLETGDRVLVYSGNNLFYPVAFVGILMAGGIFSGANPSLVARELAYQLNNTEAKFLLCSDGSLELGIEAAKSVGVGKERVFVFDDLVLEGTGKGRLGVENWAKLIESQSVGESFRWIEPENPRETVCCLNYSSGTTGVPKGVMITHYNYVANATQFTALNQLREDEPEKTKTAKWLCFLPLYHAMGQAVMIGGGPKRGIPIYIMKKFDFVQMLEALQNYKITDLTMVPPIAVALAKHPLTKKYDLSSVREIGSGAAPISGEVITEVEALWPEGDRKLKQGWGMTEATCSILGWDMRIPNPPNSVGELNANCSAKIVDPEGNEVPQGQRGEIWIQAPNVMKGYWRNPKATAEIFVDSPDGRWMRTGDVAYIDKDGKFFIVDRIKELIKVKGNQVAPAELEALLLEHPDVADAAIVGVPWEGDEVPRAYLVLKAGKRVSEEEVRAWVRERVTYYKRLTGGVRFIDAIPKNPSGKILRKILREQAKEEVLKAKL